MASQVPIDSTSRHLGNVVDAPFLTEGGVTGALVRSIDWSKTPVGPIAAWPNSLISAVGMVLHSRHPMFLWWGPELVQFYNDAYLPSFGHGKHPLAMGQCGRDCWQEIWPIISPQIDDVMRRGIASWNEDALVPIHRNGRMEEVYWTYGYSPVFDDHGRVGGTLVVCTETTTRVVAHRRSKFLRRLSEEISPYSELEAAIERTKQLTEPATADIAFFLSYHRTALSEKWQLSGSTHLSNADLARLEPVARQRIEALQQNPHARRSAFDLLITPSNPAWPEPTRQAVVIAPRVLGTDAFVFGISPRLEFDRAYAEFFDEVIEQIELAAVRLETLRVRAAVESERRNLLQKAPVATAILTGPRHVFELANPLYREIVGGREVVGKAYFEAFPELTGTPLGGVLDRVYRTGEPFVAHEYLIPLDRKGNGVIEPCYYRFNLEPLRDAHGEVYGMMAVAVDITEQVNARRGLEKTTLEREKLLIQLEAANHAKDEFLATVSHELRTPLTSILGWARLLAESNDPSRIQKGLAVIERNAKAQAQLIEDILDVSRIISGKVRMNMRRVDAGAIVNAAVETVRPLATAKQIRVHVANEADLGTLIADEDRLQQVVWNLLSNAVKFTPTGGEVSVSTSQQDSRIVIVVQDSGKGIAPVFLPHVFDRFRQDDTSTTKQQAGLGLGLAIVRHLVELHGGTVLAHSDGEGRGARFEVTLPIRAVEPRLDTIPPPKASEATLRTDKGALGRLEHVHVLVVDDHADARELVATVLEDAGATVRQADSVSAAMRVLSTQDVAVVVSDIGMPGEDGYTLIQWLRSSERPIASRGLPALALTAYARVEDRRRALAAGFQEHVAKPIDPARLVDVVAGLARR